MMFTMQRVNYFWSNCWKEAKEDSYSVSLGNTGATASLSGYIESRHFALAVASVLGFSGVARSPDGKRMLWRVPPASHPRARNLYASGIKIDSFAFMRAGVPGPPIETSPAVIGAITNPFVPTESHNIPPITSRYEELQVSIDFSEFVGVSFIANEQPGFQPDREHTRYTSVTFEPSLEILQMDTAASLAYDTGEAAKKAFPVPVGIPMPQAKAKLKWLWVPHEFISDHPGSKIPYCSRIQDSLGRVNREEFMHCLPGTVLFTGYSMEPIVVPYPDEASNSVAMQLAWNVEFEFSILNTRTDHPLPINQPWRNHGHNIFPYRGDRKFYPASVKEEGEEFNFDNPQPTLYEATDFFQIFSSTR